MFIISFFSHIFLSFSVQAFFHPRMTIYGIRLNILVQPIDKFKYLLPIRTKIYDNFFSL